MGGQLLAGFKQDMGGAALVLALAHLVMAARLPVRLLVLVPAVENSVAGNAFRPLDVLRTRAGISVENGNTDAEGRLILADCLAEATSRAPDLLVDAATLTGAARAALGADLPAVFTPDDAAWAQLERAAAAEGDPLWRLPLHGPYRRQLDSKLADLSSTGADGLGGAIIAALFLREFVGELTRWVHIDTSAFTSPAFVCPGRPEGGEAQALRALWHMLLQRYPPA
ncbi:Peptidase B [Tetrabaena socialis]|uniref:Peptidase B n=1 Tax=Tetrabaena socialis TaxID=47790 RepID=A0A2J7ZJT8_9CHLO|nr:Peptidase B [Tetrabaena socialis]|eukprot:PNH00534.1 Peptidase B [Tetrabaena socialis]